MLSICFKIGSKPKHRKPILPRQYLMEDAVTNVRNTSQISKTTPAVPIMRAIQVRETTLVNTLTLISLSCAPVLNI